LISLHWSKWWQALRQVAVRYKPLFEFRLFLACGLAVMLVIECLLVGRVLDAFYGLIGGPVAVFAALQLAGSRTPKWRKRSARIEAAVGGFAEAHQ
jgi:hypothetical protein